MTILDASADYIILINTFAVDPERTEELLALLSDATQTIRDMLGFIWANLHVSLDGRHITNYEQWRSEAEMTAMLNSPQAQSHLQKAAEIALSFMPIVYKLREIHGSSVKP